MRFYWREFVFVGLLGGFTTFSAFGFETMYLLRRHEIGWAAANAVLSDLQAAFVETRQSVSLAA